MTSRDIIIRNLTFRDPERIGMTFGFADGVMNDMWGASLSPSATWTQRRWTEGEFEYYDDEWGNVWYRVRDRSSGGEIFTPALRDWAMLNDLRLPDFAEPSRYRSATETFAKNPDHYHVFFLPGFPFAICRYLRKMEIYFEDLLLERERVDDLHDKVTGLLEAVIRQAGRTGADGVFFCEDWGTQERLLISPTLWREVFKPLYRRLCAAAREAGLHVLMHSCGYNWDILDDLAEVGVNSVQFDQPNLYGLERLADTLQRNHVCLYAPVDIQKVLPTGNRELIESTAAAMARLFGGRHGGFIAKDYGDLKGIGVKPEWNQWAYDAFVRASNA